MAIDRDALRDWHRLFGLLLTDLFSDSPFTIEIERDLSAQQQLFSASPELIGFGQGAYRQRSERTSTMLRQLFQRYRGENLDMPYTWTDFERDYIKEHFPQLTPEERRTVLESLPPEERLAGLSVEQIRNYLEKLSSARPKRTRKSRKN